MKIIDERHKVEFIDSNNERMVEKSFDSTDSLTEAYDKGRSEICDEENITISEFEKRYSVSSKVTKMSYHNPPWNNFAELQQKIRGLATINNARYVSPMKGRYEPPKFVVDANDSSDLKSQVKDYYEGLVVDEDRSEIFISATKYKKTT